MVIAQVEPLPLPGPSPLTVRKLSWIQQGTVKDFRAELPGSPQTWTSGGEYNGSAAAM